MEELIPGKVVLQKDHSGKYVGFSSVHDYIYRPKIYKDKFLYEWVQMASRVNVCKTYKHDVVIDDDKLDVIVEESKPLVSKPDRVYEIELKRQAVAVISFLSASFSGLTLWLKVVSCGGGGNI